MVWPEDCADPGPLGPLSNRPHCRRPELDGLFGLQALSLCPRRVDPIQRAQTAKVGVLSEYTRNAHSHPAGVTYCGCWVGHMGGILYPVHQRETRTIKMNNHMSRSSNFQGWDVPVEAKWEADPSPKLLIQSGPTGE